MIDLAGRQARFRGLIAGFSMSSGGLAQPVTGDDLTAALGRPDAVVWLHFNLCAGQARDWIAGCGHLPE